MQMQEQRIWWLGEVDEAIIDDYERRSVVSIDLSPEQDAPPPEVVLRFEQEMSIGDMVAVRAGTDCTLLGCLQGDAIRRPGLHCMQCVRSVTWLRLNEPRQRSAIAHLVSDMPVFEAIEAELQADLRILLDDCPEEAVARATPLRISRQPLPAPELPTLYQSPYAGRIIRDFRWREYLAANPDVAKAGGGEAVAFAHFFHQGYYERRIFDPKRLDGFDPGFYRERYPELALPSDAAAQIHYCYQGWYEQRIPNRESAWLNDARLHVYQMGKVGSHSIADALLAAGYAGGVVHAHWMTDVMTAFPGNRLCYSRILVHDRDEPVKVISATREIVSWTLSGLFQYHGDRMLNATDAGALIEEHFWNQCKSGLEWFDHQYYCGLDVYAHPFDPAEGYTRIRHPGMDLMIYRQEDLPRLEKPIAEFLGLPELSFQTRNVGDRKAYSSIYTTMLRNTRLPAALLDELYDTPFMRHFYSDAERDKARARWSAS